MRQTPHKPHFSKEVQESHTIDKERISKTSETCNTQHAEFSRQTLETLQLSHQADNEELFWGKKTLTKAGEYWKLQPEDRVPKNIPSEHNQHNMQTCKDNSIKPTI